MSSDSSSLVDCNSASTDTPGQLFRPALAYNLEPGSKPPARRTVCPTEGLHLVTQYPVLKRNDSGPRQAEFTATLEANLAHDQVGPDKISPPNHGLLFALQPGLDAHFLSIGLSLCHNRRLAVCCDAIEQRHTRSRMAEFGERCLLSGRSASKQSAVSPQSQYHVSCFTD